MKLSQLDNRSQADKGFPYHLRDHLTNEPLWDGKKPLIVMVRGRQGKMGQEAVREIVRTQKAMKDAPSEIEVMEDAHRVMVAQTLPFIAGFQNIENDDGSPATEADAERFLNLNMIRNIVKPVDGEEAPDPHPGRAYVQQIIDFIAETETQTGNESKA